MDYDKLIEHLKRRGLGNGSALGPHSGLYDDAATAIETLRAENERLRNEAEGMRSNWYKSVEKIKNLRADLARVTAERDAIERDFRAFTKQWWEEANGFPCRFCKFENSGGCEQKAKHPDDEKPCAGRWFEWRGIKED